VEEMDAADTAIASIQNWQGVNWFSKISGSAMAAT
jgi:hypothetical protein